MTDSTKYEIHMEAAGYTEVELESPGDVRGEVTVDDPRFEVHRWEVYNPETDEIVIVEG